jgi:sugar phosphate isomerase/epimerase
LGVGYGTVNWGKVARLIEMISYDGIVMVESIKQAEESLKKLRELLA